MCHYNPHPHATMLIDHFFNFAPLFLCQLP